MAPGSVRGAVDSAGEGLHELVVRQDFWRGGKHRPRGRDGRADVRRRHVCVGVGLGLPLLNRLEHVGRLGLLVQLVGNAAGVLPRFRHQVGEDRLGGVGSFFGPIFGAAAFLVLETFLAGWTENWQLAMGVILLVVVIGTKGGIAGLLERLKGRGKGAFYGSPIW